MKLISAIYKVVVSLAIIILLSSPATIIAQSTSPSTSPAISTTSPVGTAITSTTPASGVSDAFTPLTQLPGIPTVASSESLPAFFNNLYKLCIGAAAVIAILQIMRAGVKFMTNRDSFTANKEAKELITNSVLGLVLVLSPAIVFGLINPSILELNLDLGGLTPRPPVVGSSTPSGAPGTFQGNDAVLWTHEGGDRQSDTLKCASEGGTIAYGCTNTQTKVARVIQQTEACSAGEVAVNTCRAPAGSPTTGQSCLDQYESIISRPIGASCTVSPGSISIPHGCCTGTAPGNTCCGKKKTAPSTPTTNPDSTSYRWQFKFTTSSTQANSFWRSGGPFSSQQACIEGFNTFSAQNPTFLATGESTCNCNQTVAQKPCS